MTAANQKMPVQAKPHVKVMVSSQRLKNHAVILAEKLALNLIVPVNSYGSAFAAFRST